jgi:probable F420-dependent oxidoreductase
MVMSSAKPRMTIGAFARTAGDLGDGRPVRFDTMLELALAAELVGIDSFWMPDHLMFYPSEGDPIGCWELFSFLSALAARTSTLRLGSFVAAVLFRNPALLAKMVDTLDEISDGRFILGLGAGNWVAEHTAFGYPFDQRAGRFAEAIRVIAPLLRDGEVDFQGTYYQASGCVLRPRGPSASGPPIWVGAKGERMHRIAARHADGFIAIWPTDLAQLAAAWEPMAAACTAAGRDPATLDLTVGTWVQLPGDGRPAAGERAIHGSHEEIAQQFHAFAEAGVRHLIVDFRPDISVRAIEELGRVLERMASL